MSEDLEQVYLFGFSEKTGNHLERLLPLLKIQIDKGTKIGIVFIHDGVIGTTNSGKTPKAILELLNLKIKLFTMIPDLQARGIKQNNLHEGIIPIQYERLADIVDSTDKIISWM